MCDKRRKARSISVPGANNQLFCPASMTSLWHINKHDRRGNIQQTDTAAMKNVNKKHKAESDIDIHGLSLGELHNPKDIGVEVRNMHLPRFFFSTHKIKTGLRTDSLKCIQASISRWWMLIFTPLCQLLRSMKIEQLLQFPSVITLFSKPLLIWFPECPTPE